MSGKENFMSDFSIDKVGTWAVLSPQGSDMAILRNIAVLVRDLHDKQKRKNGEPYYNHLLRVASSFADTYVDTDDISNILVIDLIVTAFLHDAIEDTGVSIETIGAHLRRIYPNSYIEFIVDSVDARIKNILIALNHLSHIDGEGYFEYVMRILRLDDISHDAATLACLVKLSDLKDNTSDLNAGSLRDKYLLTRYVIKDKMQRLSKYYEAYGL